MAALQKLTDEFLTCIICQGVYQDPVTLHCGHSFCTSCLTSYVISRPEAHTDKTLPCPHCRSVTQVPDPEKPAEEWVSQMKTGFFVKGLVDTFVTVDALKDQTLCSVCQGAGESTPADKWCTDCNEALCSKCLDLHKQYPKFRQHNTADIAEGLKQHKAAQKQNCAEHKDEKLKIFCKDCDIAICQLCCSVVHRKCESVVTLTEVYPEMQQDVINKVLDMQFESVKHDAVLSERKSQLGRLMETCDEAMTELDSACDAFIKSVETKRNKLKKKIQGETDKAARLLTSDMEDADVKVRHCERDVASIQATMQTYSEIELYGLYKSFCSKKNPDLSKTEDTKKKLEPRLIEIHFKSNTDKLNKNLNSLNLGVIDVVHEEVREDAETNADAEEDDDTRSECSEVDNRSECSEAGPDKKRRPRAKKPPKQKRPDRKPGGPPPLPVYSDLQSLMDALSKFSSKENLAKRGKPGGGGGKPGKPKGPAPVPGKPKGPAPVHVDHIEVKADIDRFEPQLDDLITVADGDGVILVLSDIRNKKVKAMYLRNNQKLFVEFQQPPGGLTQVSDNDIAVSVGMALRIYIMRLRSLRSTCDLQIVNHFDTKVGYSRICSLDGNSMAGIAPGSNSIDILDSKGSLIKRIQNENISRPFIYRTKSPGQFILTDPELHAVFKMTTNNKTLFKYEPYGAHRLVNNVGACMDNKGNILVVNRGCNKVIMINNEGKFVKPIMQLDTPAQKLAYIACDKKNRIYLTFEDRNISVYQI